MQRITRLPVQRRGTYIECTQDCRPNGQIFHPVDLPWQINRAAREEGEQEKEEKGKEINTTVTE